MNIAVSGNTAAVGRNVYGVILSNTGTILATSTNTLTIANGDLNTFRTFNFSPSVAVAANQLVYYGLAQTANATAYYPIGTYVNPYLTTSYYTTALAGGTPTLVASNLGQMGIELNLTGTCTLGVESVDDVKENLTIFPNPTSTNLNVRLQSVEANTSLEVYNAIGQVVIPAQKVSSTTFELNVSSLTKGVYFLKISNDSKMSSVKFAVER
jgi:hypothetical protein